MGFSYRFSIFVVLAIIAIVVFVVLFIKSWWEETKKEHNDRR